jgi:hypothetical protein
MKTLIALSVLVLSTGPTASASPKRFTYYFGQARIIQLLTGERKTQEALVLKSVDPDTSMISEVACVRFLGGAAAQLLAVYAKVNPRNNTLVLADTPDGETGRNMSGTGSLQGKPWEWHTLKFSIQYDDGRNQALIEDVNYIVGNQLIARKQVFAPDGRAFQLYEAELEEISAEDHARESARMNCVH